MERVHGPQTPFESYCFSCRVTFPAETRRCVHCGGRTARAGQVQAGHVLTGAGEAPPMMAEGVSVGEDAIEEEIAISPLRRFGGLFIWALVALSALISNLCQGA